MTREDPGTTLIGAANFSQNYGWTCVAPVIGGNVFNLVFGRVYDAHTVSVTRSLRGRRLMAARLAGSASRLPLPPTCRPRLPDAEAASTCQATRRTPVRLVP